MNVMPPSKREALSARIYRGLCTAAADDAIAVVAACDFTLERLQDKLPAPEIGAAAPYWSSARDEAALWAEVASDRQVLGMLVACLDRISGSKAVQRDREALLVALWNTLPADRRAAFLANVAGQGTER
jgi:hypothetical protein